jgi:hypothetical protein
MLGFYKQQVITGDDYNAVRGKAVLKAHQWNELWGKRTSAEERRSERAMAALDKEAEAGGG